MTPIEDFIVAISTALPGVRIRQLQVTHPADDAGLWFVTHPASGVEVNVEPYNGEFPFLIENSKDDSRLSTVTVEETVSAVCAALELKQASRPVGPMSA
jgi:hypothetical protein